MSFALIASVEDFGQEFPQSVVWREKHESHLLKLSLEFRMWMARSEWVRIPPIVKRHLKWRNAMFPKEMLRWKGECMLEMCREGFRRVSKRSRQRPLHQIS